MKQTINELSKLLRPDNNFTGDYSFYGVVQSAIIDSDNKVTGYNVEVGDSLIEARKLAGADIGDVVLCTTLSNGVTVISGTLDGDKDAVHAGELAEETNNYFWFTSSNTGFGKGAHITQKTQAEVLADPTNAGGNVLIDSDSLDIRDGENILATFSAEETRVGSYESSNIRLEGTGISAKKSDGSEYFNVGIIGNEQQYVSVSKDDTGRGAFAWLTGSGGSDEDFINLHSAIASNGVFGVRLDITVDYNTSSSDHHYSGTSTRTYKYEAFHKGTSYTYTKMNSSPNIEEARIVYSTYPNTNIWYVDASVNSAFLDWYFDYGWRYARVVLKMYATVNTTAPAYSFGINTDVSKKLGFAIGNGTIPSEVGLAMGKYNEEDSNDDYALIIGNGTDDDNRSDALTVDWSGNLAIAGKHQELYKITTLPIETGSIDADSYKSGQNYPMTTVDGYNAVGIVGWSTSNWRIQPTSHYITSNTQIYAGFANYKAPPSSGTSSASATITFRVLWLKATSA